MRRTTITAKGLEGVSPGSGWATVKRVAPYLWPKGETGVKTRVVLALLVLLAAKVIAVATPLLFKAAIDSMSGLEAAGWTLGLGAVALTIGYGLARLLSNGFQQLRDVIFYVVGIRALRLLATETFAHIHALSLRYHLTRKTGALSRIIDRGVKGVDFLVRFMLLSMGPLVIELLLVAIALFYFFDISYLIVVGVTIWLYAWFTFKVSEARLKQRKIMNDQDQDATQKAVDSLLNFETVKYFGAEARETERYHGAMERYGQAAVISTNSLAALNFGQAFIITAGLVVVMVMAAIGVNNGSLTVGDYVMVNAYMIQITMPLNFLGTVYREIRQALVDMADMFELLGQPAEVTDAPDAAALQVTGGEVTFRDVRFAYDPERQILNGVSFSVPPGRTLALVGASGSGKSTIGRLLFRFYDVSDGAIEVDGQDIRSVTQASLHDVIGVVPQDTVLFNDTIFYNIAYGRPSASVAEIEEAARAAKIHDFIVSLPDGYETKVGERGLKLSGGEKQRVGIARTILKNPPILILDEATSALDSRTERDIQGELQAISHGRTVIAIAHRLSTIADADEILVLDKGLVVERGTHSALVAKGGAYAALWHRQASEQDLPAAAE
jgi:ATP-binding cassette, subfamily B, heavy metal transporter